MPVPIRVQLKRTKGFRLQDAASNGLPVAKVDRSTRWGNPFKIDNVRMRNGDWQVFWCTDGRLAGPPVGHYGTKAEALTACVRHYRSRMEGDAGNLLRHQAAVELRGKNLACWCRLDGPPCHADVLLELANVSPSLEEADRG